MPTFHDPGADTSDQRRVNSVFNVAHTHLLDLASDLVDEIDHVARANEAPAGARGAFSVRAARRLDDAEAELAGVVAGAVPARERWIEQVQRCHGWPPVVSFGTDRH